MMRNKKTGSSLHLTGFFVPLQLTAFFTFFCACD